MTPPDNGVFTPNDPDNTDNTSVVIVLWQPCILYQYLPTLALSSVEGKYSPTNFQVAPNYEIAQLNVYSTEE